MDELNEYNSILETDDRREIIKQKRCQYYDDWIVRKDLNKSVSFLTDTELDIRRASKKLISGACIESIRFNTKEAEAADDFTEKTFTEPIWKQVQHVLIM